GADGSVGWALDAAHGSLSIHRSGEGTGDRVDVPLRTGPAAADRVRGTGITETGLVDVRVQAIDAERRRAEIPEGARGALVEADAIAITLFSTEWPSRLCGTSSSKRVRWRARARGRLRPGAFTYSAWRRVVPGTGRSHIGCSVCSARPSGASPASYATDCPGTPHAGIVPRGIGDSTNSARPPAPSRCSASPAA